MKIRELAEQYGYQLGCIDHSCIFGGPSGMGTNGGCRCLPRGTNWTESEVIEARRMIRNLLDILRQIAK